MTLEAQTIARACGKNHVHNLEPEDLVALTDRGRGHGAACRWPAPTGFRARTASDQARRARAASDQQSTKQGELHGNRSRRNSPRRTAIKYFLISYTDLFGGQRAKLVPAQAIADMQKDGAGFAGFATWLDMTPAHPDMLGHARSGQR